MFANSNRYLLRPASSHTPWNSGPCVLGVHDATMTLLSLCSLMASRIEASPSSAQLYRVPVAKTTSGSVFVYSTTDGTSTNPPMFVPQWQTKTPIRKSSDPGSAGVSGGCSSVSPGVSGGCSGCSTGASGASSSCLTGVPRTCSCSSVRRSPPWQERSQQLSQLRPTPQ